MHQTVMLRVDLKEHLKYRDNQSEGEKREKCRQQVEQYIERQAFLVRRHKSAENDNKFFHL